MRDKLDIHIKQPIEFRILEITRHSLGRDTVTVLFNGDKYTLRVDDTCRYTFRFDYTED